jgi:hypothetical protein
LVQWLRDRRINCAMSLLNARMRWSNSGNWLWIRLPAFRLMLLLRRLQGSARVLRSTSESR